MHIQADNQLSIYCQTHYEATKNGPSWQAVSVHRLKFKKLYMEKQSSLWSQVVSIWRWSSLIWLCFQITGDCGIKAQMFGLCWNQCSREGHCLWLWLVPKWSRGDHDWCQSDLVVIMIGDKEIRRWSWLVTKRYGCDHDWWQSKPEVIMIGAKTIQRWSWLVPKQSWGDHDWWKSDSEVIMISEKAIWRWSWLVTKQSGGEIQY